MAVHNNKTSDQICLRRRHLTERMDDGISRLFALIVVQHSTGSLFLIGSAAIVRNSAVRCGAVWCGVVRCRAACVQQRDPLCSHYVVNFTDANAVKAAAAVWVHQFYAWLEKTAGRRISSSHFFLISRSYLLVTLL